MGLPVFTIEDIRSWGPCYDPSEFLPEDWRGNALDLLKVKECKFEDRLWVLSRKECIDESTLRIFAVFCARESLALQANPDPRSVAACDVAERFAKGEATRDELDAAWSAARSAAESAAESAASAARSAARSAAWSAAWSAESAAWSAESTARSAAWSAESAAWSAAESAQEAKLTEMLEALILIEEKSNVGT